MQAFLISDDEIYSKRLILLLNKDSLLPFKLKYIEAIQVEKYNFKSEDFILFDLDLLNFYEKSQDKFKNSHILFLSKDIYLYKSVEFLKQNQLIYKYQSYKKIQSLILAYLAKIKHIDLVKSEMKTKLISIYSPINRCAKSTLAFNLATLLSEKNKVLLISFDNYFAFQNKEKINDLTKLSLSDFLYSYIKFDLNISQIKNHINISNNLHLINSTNTFEDIYSLDESQYYDLLSQITKNLDYEYFILDLANMGFKLSKILELSFTFIVPFSSDFVSKLKLNHFRQEFESALLEKKEDFIDKINFLEIKEKDDILEKAKKIKMDLEEDKWNI